MPKEVISSETNGTRKNSARYARPGTSRARAIGPPRRRAGSRGVCVPAGTSAEIAISGGLTVRVDPIRVRRGDGLRRLDPGGGIQPERVLAPPCDPDLRPRRE